MTARFWLTGLARQRAPMTRILFSACLLLVAAATSVSAAISVASPGTGTAGAVAVVGTPLPPGWELCVLAGVSAPATRANVSNLDEWQAAEGGSTNNTAAFNPFNTTRTTDVEGAPLPVSSMVGGFPAFPDWLTGCSATVATILQPNMSVIAAALRAGNVAPPGQFLVDVDGSAWCAPSAGQPCYETAIAASGGKIPGVVASSSALDVYGNVQSDLRAYQLATTTVAAQQNTQAGLSLEVVRAQRKVATAQAHYEQVEHELGTFAVSEYIHNGLYDSSTLAAGGSTSGSQTGLAAQQYTNVAATDILNTVQAASAALTSDQGNLADSDRGLQRAGAALLADEAAESHALEKLINDVATLQTAGACTTVSIIATPSAASNSSPSSPAGAAGSTSTTTSTTVPTTSTTVSSTTTPSSTSTTTTTTLPTTSTTTTPGSTAAAPASGAASLRPAVRGGGTTSTTASSTTTTASTTTTSQPPRSKQGASSATPAQVNPGGLGALQGCVSALSPRSSNA